MMLRCTLPILLSVLLSLFHYGLDDVEECNGELIPSFCLPQVENTNPRPMSVHFVEVSKKLKICFFHSLSQSRK